MSGTTIHNPYAVLVEGWHERRLVPAFIRDRALALDVEVFCYEGRNNLRRYLTGFIRAPGFSNLRGIAILRDADADASAAFQSVSASLRDIGLPVPTAQLVAAVGPPRVAVLIFPGGNQQGMLEDALMASVGTDPVIRCVDAYLNCIRNSGVPGPTNASKARAHAFLASRPVPGKRLDRAAEAGYFVLTNRALDPLQKLLEAISA